jgi:hypothetical protein
MVSAVTAVFTTPRSDRTRDGPTLSQQLDMGETHFVILEPSRIITLHYIRKYRSRPLSIKDIKNKGTDELQRCPWLQSSVASF